MIIKKTILSVVFSLLLCVYAQAYDVKLLSEIPVKGKVTGIGVNPVSDTAAAISETAQSLSIINTASSAVTHEVALPEAPSGVAVDRTRNTAVVFSRKGTIFLVDLGTAELVATMDAGKEAFSAAVDETYNKIIIGVDGGLKIVDPAGGPEANVAIDGKSVRIVQGQTGYVVASRSDDGTLLRLVDPSTGKIVRETTLSGEVLSIAIDDALRLLLVTQTDKAGLFLFDSASLKLLGQIQTDKEYAIVAVNPSVHSAVLANTQDGSVTVLDLEQKTVLAVIPLFGQAGPVGVDTGRNRALVARDNGLVMVQLENPVPSITGLFPQESAAGENDLLLSISGFKFLKESQAWFNNCNSSSLFDTNELLKATIPPDRLQYPGDVAVSVCNPPPGGGKSNEFKFKVLTPVPQLTLLTPDAAVVVTPFTLKVGGRNFLPNATISLGGKKLATRYLSSTVLEAPIDAVLLSAKGNLPVSVTNSGQISFTSNVLNLLVMSAEEASSKKNAKMQASASQGTGVLVGRVLNTAMQPVMGVTVKHKNITAKTDEKGDFTLENVPAGRRTILIDGSTAVDTLGHYPTIPISADIMANQLNPMPFTPYLHRQKHRNFVSINPAKETVLTDPEIPGFEMRIPQGVNIIGWDGKANQRVSVRTVPVNRLPVKPVPANANIRTVYMFYFDKVGGGIPDRPVPVKAPNDLGLLPGEKAVLWYYDESPNEGEAPNDWAIAGTGTVTPDGRFIVSDPGAGIPKYCCGAAGFGGNSSSLPTSGKEQCGGKAGDPVDIATGYFFHEKTDLVIPGIIPVKIKRYYRSRDGGSAVQGSNVGLGAFGKGMYFEYDWWLGSYSSMLRLTKPGTYHYDFAQQPDGSYINTTDPEFSAANVTVNVDGTKTLRMRDGWTYNFNTYGELVQVVDRNGNAITITRVHAGPGGDWGGVISQITTAEGRVLTFNRTYTGNFYRIDSITDNIGRTVAYSYESDPFNSFPRLKQVVFPDGSNIQYGYDTSTGLMTTITNGRSIVEVTNVYDANQRVTSQTHADSGLYTFDYSVAGQMTMTAPNSSQTTWSYNAYGYITQKISPDGTTTYERESGTNRIASVTDPLNRMTGYVYYNTNDAKNGLVYTITDPLNNVTTLDYENTYGLLTRITDEMAKLTTVSYTPTGNPPVQAVITDPLSNQTTINFNGYGMPTSVTDPNGNSITLSFDPNHHSELTGITDALGNSFGYTYDGIGRPVTVTDAKNATTRYGYDPMSRVNSVTDPFGNATSFYYDANGNLSTITDAKLNSISYDYDNRDRINKMTDQLGRYETYAYYTGSQITPSTGDNLKSYTDRKGQTTTFNQYDSMDRLKLVTFNDSSTVQLNYDAAGRATGIIDSISDTIDLTYNDYGSCSSCSGRGLDLISQVTTQLSTINYTYRGDGRRDTMSVTGEPVVTYAYDDAGRLTGIIRNVGGTSRTYNLGYDNAGRRTSLQIPLANGTDYVASSYGYDNANRPTNLLLQGAASIIDNLSYSYDPNGNRNTFGRIAGQTLSPSVANTNYDAANEMLGYNSNNLAYDANGNLQTRTDSCGTTTYTWDARNRLTGISGYKPDCSALTASFAYDSLNRRISKTVNGTTTQYVYDDQDIIQEITGGVTTSYIRPLNIDDPLTRTNSTVTRHYVRDALGSIVALVDDTGATKTTYVYDAFGNVATSGENSDNPFQYTGRENDGTGLYYYRARYYSPEMQRFISEDPIRLAGGGLNYYAYVQNNPVNWIDPLGLWTANIGISGSINIPIIGPVGVGGQGFAGIAYDGTHWAWYWGGGGGVGGGAGGSLGIQFGGSNAKSVCDLRGPFGFASASGGGGLIIGGEGYKGSGSNGQSVTGGNFFIGGGTPGVSGTGGVTYTWVKPW